jgi:hypothetical protein
MVQPTTRHHLVTLSLRDADMNKMNVYQRTTTSPLFDWFMRYGFLAMAGIAGPLLLLGAEIVVLPSVANYSPVQDSISILAWTGLGWIESGTFLITGLLLEVFAAILLLGIRGSGGFNLGILLLTCSGFGLILVGAFRTDIPYFPHTIGGTIHGIAANTTFALLPLAILLIAPSLKKDPYWRSTFIFSIATAVFALCWIAIYRLWLPQELGWFGLYERILAGVEIIWVEVMAFWLLRLFLKSAQVAPGYDFNTPGNSQYRLN